MKRSCAILTLFLILGTVGRGTDGKENSAEKEYQWGKRIGDCLVRGCVIFSANIAAVGPLRMETDTETADDAMGMKTLDIKINEWLYGKRESSKENIQIVQFSAPALGRGAEGPWVAWQTFKASPGEQVTIVRWSPSAHQRPVYHEEPIDAVLVASSETEIAAIREIVKYQLDLERDPDQIMNSPRVLAETKNPMLAGYLFLVLRDRESAKDVNRAGTVLAELLENKNLPAGAWRDIASCLGSNFYRFSTATQDVVARSLVSSAASDDPEPAIAGLMALARISDGTDLSAYLRGNEQKLVHNLKEYFASGAVVMNTARLESQLGLQKQE